MHSTGEKIQYKLLGPKTGRFLLLGATDEIN